MYLIEGNIGAGKSTMCNLLQTYRSKYKTIVEPVKQWHTPENGKSLLESFYQDPYRWSYTMETFTLINRLKEYHEHVKHDSTKTLIFERSLYSGFYCFAQNGKNSGFLNSIEWSIYSEWMDFFLKSENLIPDGFIYLKATPETCQSRINKRLRSGESEISLQYLTEIDKLHDEFLCNENSRPSFLKDVPVLVLNVEEEFSSSSKNIASHLDSIDLFIKTDKKI